MKMKKEFLDKCTDKINKFKKSYNKNKSIKIKGMSIILTLILMFFLSSNFLFNRDFNVKSTELNKQFSINNIDIQLVNREYNSGTGLVELMLKVKNKNLAQNDNLEFAVNEKHDPSKIYKPNIIKVSDDEYVVYSKLPLKWEAMCLKVTNKNIVDSTTNNYIKLYSSVNDTILNDNLVEENKVQCSIQFINLDINELNKEINNLNENIKKNNDYIEKINSNINDLEANKKYRTDEENKDAMTEISSNKTLIEEKKRDNEELNNEVKEYKERISKLEQKKVDLSNSN